MLVCVRTTIRLNERLLRDLKKLAAARGRTLTAVIEDAVRQFLAHTTAANARPKAPPFRIITFKGRLRPGADLDDSAALLDLMETTAAPRRR